jgi:bifunctional DNA-binding transcriptional regulator/antitoxin component of YhaV-PrlF toxin-antitoxin module
MNETVSIQKIGSGYGIILPEKHLDKVGWKEGDLVEIRSDSEHIEFVDARAHNPENDENLTAGTAMRNYYAALKQLARA